MKMKHFIKTSDTSAATGLLPGTRQGFFFLISFLLFGIACERGEHFQLILDEQGEKVDVLVGGQYFTSYVYAEEFKKPVLYPLTTSQGTLITREFQRREPGDRRAHPHQVGLWLTYGDVNGRDFWGVSTAYPPPERYDSYGIIRHREITGMTARRGRATLQTSKDWIGLDGVKLLEEDTRYVFSGSDSRRVIDRVTTLTAYGQDVLFKDNKEGMAGLRVNRELSHPDTGEGSTGIYRSSEGHEGHHVWGTRAKWMKLSGQIEEEQIQILFLDHSDNVGYPTYWHARGYGLFAANPLGPSDLVDGVAPLNFFLPRGESVTFTYRFVIGSNLLIDDERAEAEWRDFIKAY